MLLDSTSPKRKPEVISTRISRGRALANPRKATKIASDVRKAISRSLIRNAAAEQLMSELVNFAKIHPLAGREKLVIVLSHQPTVPKIVFPALRLPIAPSKSLRRAADWHSKYILYRWYIDHSSSAPAPICTKSINREGSNGYSSFVPENSVLRALNGITNETIAWSLHDMLIQTSSHQCNVWAETTWHK